MIFQNLTQRDRNSEIEKSKNRNRSKKGKK